MSNPTTPGVSVEEITKLPYSIALIDTCTSSNQLRHFSLNP
ncbi:hypothetical protein [Chryseobacterium sp. 5_R23647]|nr:hypothetical protein [Chryseobacterium sp. 5_R23647]